MNESLALRSLLTRPIVLIGLMGSGKSRVGAELARALDLTFYDTDKLVEDKAGKSISEIFYQDGEEKFRQAERNTVFEVLEKGTVVIATGGGAVMNDGVSELLLQKAWTVWLKADVSELEKRLSGSGHRPLLREKNISDVLQEMLDKRRPRYELAHIVVDTTGKALRESVSEVIKALSDFLKKDRL